MSPRNRRRFSSRQATRRLMAAAGEHFVKMVTRDPERAFVLFVPEEAMVLWPTLRKDVRRLAGALLPNRAGWNVVIYGRDA